MGAKCKKCGKDVGCPCNLKDGLCSVCRTIKSKIENVISHFKELH